MATIDGNEALKCLDCERSDSRVTDLQPDPAAGDPDRGDRRPAPGRCRTRGATTGAPRCVNGVAGMAAIYSATRLDWNRVWQAAAAEAAENPAARKLVLIYLQGGADSLNMFVPTEAGQYSRYMAQRANIARLQGASVSLQQVGATPFAGAAGSQIGVREPAAVRCDEQPAVHDGRHPGRCRRPRHAVRRRHRRSGLEPGRVPGGRLQPGQPLALRLPRLLVRGCR